MFGRSNGAKKKQSWKGGRYEVGGDGVKRETDEWDSSGLEIEKCQKINEVKKRRNIYGRLNDVRKKYF